MDSGKLTYIAFDELGQQEGDTSPSDYRFCATVRRWAAERQLFETVYEERKDKLYALRKSSLRSAFASRVRQSLAVCGNILVILSGETRKSGSLLSFEIAEAVDHFNLPLILAYIDYRAVADPSALSGYWPNELRQRIQGGVARAIHIPFNKHAIIDAVCQFTVSNRPLTAVNHYSEYAHRKFRCIPPEMPFGNCLRKPRLAAPGA